MQAAIEIKVEPRGDPSQTEERALGSWHSERRGPATDIEPSYSRPKLTKKLTPFPSFRAAMLPPIFAK